MAPSRKAQTRLQFTPLSSSSPAKKEYTDSAQNRLANVRFNGAEERQSRIQGMAAMPTPEPSSQDPPECGNYAETTAGQDKDDEEIELPAAKRRRTSEKPYQNTLTPRRSSRLLHQTLPNERPASSASSSSSLRLHSVEIPSPTPLRRTRSARSDTAAVQSSPPMRINTDLSSLGSPETSGDDDDALVTKPAQRRYPRKPAAAKDDFVVPDDENLAPPANEDGFPATPRERRRSRTLKQTPRKRRLESRREHQELKEDLEDLQDSDSPQLQTSRTRGAPVNRQRERRRAYIELLKRRRAGERDPVQFDADDDEELEDVGKIAKNTSSGSAAILNRQRHIYSEKSSEEDDQQQNPASDIDEDDFVVEDEEDASSDLLGRPHPEIPLEFTSYASAKPKELFIYVIEWLVKNKIAPAFSRHDQLWRLAFTKIKDEITAQTSSRLKSSAWTGSFAKALSARPVLKTSRLAPGENFMHGCDACNKQNRPAQYDFVFSGSAYHHDSLEPIDPESACEDEVGHENASVDSQGNPLSPTNTHFLLGRYCAANAELAHKFTHWKYNLNESLMGYLESQGVLSAEEIVRRERAKGGQRKREREAEEIVDQMKATGVIEDLWKGFKDDLDDARIGMEGYERKGTRGDQRIGSVKVPVEVMVAGDDDEGEKPEVRDFRPTTDREAPQMGVLASGGEGK